MRAKLLCSVAVCLAAACSSRPAASPGPSGTTLIGRWTATIQGAPCSFDLELMADGTARSNFLNDDSPQELCNHRSVTYATTRDSLVLSVGDRVVRYCWYSLADSHLDVACDEHRPPPPGAPPIRLSPVVEEAPSGSEAPSLVGDWKDGSVRFTFLPGGQAVVRDAPIGYRVLSAHDIELSWPGPERCTYEFRGKDELLLTCPSLSLDLRR